MVRLLALLVSGMLVAGVQTARAQAADPLPEAVASGDWAHVRSLAEAALARNRRDPATWTYLGLAQDHLDEHRQALASFQEAVRLAPGATYALNNLGAAYETNRQPERAIAEYRRSLALDGRQSAALVNLGRLLAGNGPAAQPEAEHLLARAWALAPEPALAQSLLLLAPCASGEAAAHEPVATVEPYVAALGAAPAQLTPGDRLAVAHAALACGYAVPAATLYRSVLEADPADLHAVVGLAQTQLASGQEREAGLTLERAVAGGAESAPLYALLSQVYFVTGHTDHAVDALKRAIELAPGDATLRFRYGMLLLDAKAPRAAELRTRQALQQFPNSARLWFALGVSQFDQTEPAQAQVSFDRAIALDGRFAPAQAYRGLCALDGGRYAEAESWYRRAIALDPDAADLHALLSEALEHEHPATDAEVRAELERSVTLDPKLAASFLALSRIDLADGRPADSVAAAHRALALDPKLRQAHFYLARAYRQLHDMAQSDAEAKLFAEQRTDADTAEHEAYLARVRQLSHTTF